MAAPLAPIIRDDIDLTATQLGNAASASVAGTVFSRILMGSLCDTIGPRKAYGVLMLLTALPCYAMTCATKYGHFLACRLLIGFSLASFVSTQYWTSSMFTPRIVGGANAITGGWGNLGGGVTQIVTPIMYEYFLRHGPPFRAWRQCYFAPGLLHTLAGMLILCVGQDGPDGNYAQLAKLGQRQADSKAAWANFKTGVTNYRMWIFTLTYGYVASACARHPATPRRINPARLAHCHSFCFGVELVVDNVLAGATTFWQAPAARLWRARASACALTPLAAALRQITSLTTSTSI